MSQRYDILSVNAVVLLASGYGYMLTGQHPTSMLLFLLSLINLVSVISWRVSDLEKHRREQQMLMDEEDEETEEEEEEEEEEDVEDEPVLHYCGREECGAEITNLAGAGLCAGCGLVYYCDQECQRADWKAGHKLVCDKNVPTEDQPPVTEEQPLTTEEQVTEVPEVPEFLPALSLPQDTAAEEPTRDTISTSNHTKTHLASMTTRSSRIKDVVI